MTNENSEISMKALSNLHIEDRNIFIDEIESTISKIENSQISKQGRTIVVCPDYPAENQVNKMAFVHKRVLAYKKNGLDVDVLRVHPNLNNTKRTYEGVEVYDCNPKFLFDTLQSGDVDTVCVHFLEPHIWEELKKFKDIMRIIIWIHGYEIRPWWRTKFNLTTEEKLSRAKKITSFLLDYWGEIFAQSNNSNIHFIFVSECFAKEVFEDYKIHLHKTSYSIIHNYIDTELFSYYPKIPEQRLKLFSIRSFSTPKYANDLMVKIILELSEKKYFKELEFFIAGRGDLFEELTKPLLKFDNVTLKETFYTQAELLSIHKEQGIVLSPTRWDSQGVSRDEAMSCGCVPICNINSAVSEFVDSTCGILAEGEDVSKMVEGIDFLYNNPDKFLELSENSAKRIRSQTSEEYTIDKEVKLIKQSKFVSSKIVNGLSITGLRNQNTFQKIQETNNFCGINLLEKWSIYFCDKENTILDIGAEIGNDILYWYECVKQIYYFEPEKLNNIILKYNLKINDVANVQNIEENNLSDKENTQINQFFDIFSLLSKLDKIDAVKISMKRFDISLFDDMTIIFDKFKPNIWLEVTAETCAKVLPMLLSLNYVIVDIVHFNVMLVHKSKNSRNEKFDFIQLYSFTCNLMNEFDTLSIKSKKIVEAYREISKK